MIKMLVVDDEQDVEMLFSQRFRKELKNGEVRIHFAFSGEDALSTDTGPVRSRIGA